MQFEIRRALPSDAAGIAEAHRDSIHSIGPLFYPQEVVDAWGSDLASDVYVRAMEIGEVFFVAIGEINGESSVLGFASDYSIEGSVHGTSVYVRGLAARQGIGSALLRSAEVCAAANGATSIRIEASLAGVQFYKINGYNEVGRGATRLMSGYPIECVFMCKVLKEEPAH